MSKFLQNNHTVLNSLKSSGELHQKLTMAFFLLVMSALFSCSSPETLTGGRQLSQENEAAPEETAPPVDPKRDPNYKDAEEFDAFLQQKLPESQVIRLQKNCQRFPTQNVFCFSVINHDYFEKKVEARKASRVSGRKKLKRVYPKFRKGELKNWIELRYASVSASLRGISGLKQPELQTIKKVALEETKCPNNAAISIAAALEDGLPDKASNFEIAQLYQLGGKCIQNNSSDRTTMLTRSGLFYFADQKYQEAKIAFQQASADQSAFTARAVYWLHRVHIKLGEEEQAETLKSQLMERYPFAFHTLVAITAQNDDPGVLLDKEAPNQLRRSQQMPLINPLIEQVEILNRLGFDDSAKKVLDWAVAESHGTEPELRVYLAGLKKEHGDYFSKISLLSDVLYRNPNLVSKDTMELYFPKVFFPIFEAQSSVIDPYLLLSIARRESAFNVKAMSHANARGLMQILPKVRNQILKGKDLLDADDNVAVGARYIVKLLERLDGQIHFALAAYNAGPSRVKTWMERYPVADPILFIDIIPYRETREYVASILRNYYWYRRIHLGGKKITPERFLELAITRGG